MLLLVPVSTFCWPGEFVKWGIGVLSAACGVGMSWKIVAMIESMASRHRARVGGMFDAQ